ncbi:MAG: cupin domain-containing protein [Candidatus Omnitrophica bacterium]|nr:cupin domain-containing protein [Candidatus Omnitrophota bacterium]
MTGPKAVRIKDDGSRQRLLEGRPATSGMKSGYVKLEEGGSVGRHSTKEREEALVIMEGEARVCCEGSEPLMAKAESVVYIPPDTPHDVINAGRGPLRYVYVVSPAGERLSG